MKTSKTKPEDITLLSKLLRLSGEVVIYDPSGKINSSSFFIARDITTLLKNASDRKVCINLSGKALEVLTFDFILEFNSVKRKYKSFFVEHFLSINNRDGSIRWFLPEYSKQANFLTLYNGSGLKATLFNILAKMAFGLGLKHWFCQGSFCLYAREENYFQIKIGGRDLAVFTGTIGENRKAVAAICEYGKAKAFVKIPISERAKGLIQIEDEHLKIVNEYDFEKLIIPTSKMKEIGLELTNIKPQIANGTTDITTLHIKALKDLYANTFQVKMFSTLEQFSKTKKRIEALKALKNEKVNNIPNQKVDRLAYNIKVLLSNLDEKELVAVAYAHGDFTPWNMFISENHVHLYDWELAMPEQLFLYDAFHFVFQSSVLIMHQSFEQIKMKVEKLKENPIVLDLIERYGLNYWDCYCWYLIQNCTYYLGLYLKQKSLHPQGHWLIDCWIEATNDAIKSRQQKVEVIL